MNKFFAAAIAVFALFAMACGTASSYKSSIALPGFTGILTPDGKPMVTPDGKLMVAPNELAATGDVTEVNQHLVGTLDASGNLAAGATVVRDQNSMSAAAAKLKLDLEKQKTEQIKAANPPDVYVVAVRTVKASAQRSGNNHSTSHQSSRSNSPRTTRTSTSPGRNTHGGSKGRH